MNKKIIIVGGVAGGASTAARLRRLDENVDIIMVEKGEYISFANCGLPYYIGETIDERGKLIVQTVEEMSSKFNLDIRNLNEVISIDKENKKVKINNYRTNEEYEETYDILVLSPGAAPLKPVILGINECDNLFTLRNIPDTDKIKSYVDNNKPKHVTVIGGGFIGLEMAENLHARGIDITLVEAGEQVMAPLDIEMASIIHEHLIDKNVELILKDGVSAFESKGKKIILSSGKEITTDMIILSIGVKPETTIAREANLNLNERGAIVVDKFMKTSDPSIYALGDAVEVMDFVNKKPTMIPLAWPANRQGRIVADNICGKNTEYK
jgi:NADPH-dependent 2,4-dienoyl-CoA reductase/sulfur reductase-like enzyme